MESFSLIKYKWESGVYTLKEMIQLVKQQELSQQQFFDITRYDYNNIKQSDKALKIKILETNENL